MSPHGPRALLKERVGSSDASALEAQMSDDEVDGILRLFPERYQAISREAAVSDVRKKLAAQRFESRRQQLARELRSKHAVSITLPVPRVDVSTTNRPVLGPPDAPVGRFWEYHDRLFEKHRCFQSPDSGRRVQEDVLEGRALGIAGTPTVFVNGRLVPGIREAITNAIGEELEERAGPLASAATK